MVPIKTNDNIVNKNFQTTAQEIDALKLRLQDIEAKCSMLLRAVNRIGVKL